jgi:hypothetical protein
VHFSRSLYTNVAREAWPAAGSGQRRSICCQSSVMRCAGSIGLAVGVSSLPGVLRGVPYMSSVTDACRSSLNAVQIPRRTKGSTSVHCWSAWHMMAVFRVRWKRSMSLLVAGWWAVVRES